MFTVCLVNKTKFRAFCLGILCMAVFITTDRLYAFTIAETATTMEVAETIDGTEARSVLGGKNRQGRENQRDRSGTINIDTLLKELLEDINEQKYPDKKSTLNTAKLLLAAKKDLDESDSSATCQYFMLQAWNDYFAGNKDRALKASLKAYKTDAANSDARLTHTAIALINGEKPIVLDPEKEDQAQRRPPQNERMNPTGPMGPRGNMPPPARSASRSRSDAILQLDESALNDKMLANTVEPLNLNCLNSTSFSYDQDSALCAMFWQMGLKDTSSVADPNDKKKKSKTPTAPARPAYPDPRQAMMFGQNNNNRRGNNQNDPLSAQMDAFGQLFANNIDNPAVKFVAINIDTAKNAKSGVTQKLMENPWPWAQVVAGDPTNNLDISQAFADLDTDKNSIVIVDQEGAVKYAGPAEGFLAPLVINDLAPASAEIQNTAIVKSNSSPPKKTPEQRTTAAAKKPPAAKTAPAPEKIIDDEEYFDPQAEKLLENGRGFIKIGHLTSYKKGIDLCRQVIADYPNTKYEQEARVILRGVPERHHKRYNITKEELGLE
ncbi:MAG: hypothetical protein JW912_08400 [Sedimentisphaerales bacterium]|nr:hypothetical protein [Sedimentisphaerales bacterium]